MYSHSKYCYSQIDQFTDIFKTGTHKIQANKIDSIC